jgi:hypothetical protein
MAGDVGEGGKWLYYVVSRHRSACLSGTVSGRFGIDWALVSKTAGGPWVLAADDALERLSQRRRCAAPRLTSVGDAELFEQFRPSVVARQIELVAKQGRAMTTVLPPEATLENKGGEPDRRSAGTWTRSAAWTHFRFFRARLFDFVRFSREKLAE